MTDKDFEPTIASRASDRGIAASLAFQFSESYHFIVLSQGVLVALQKPCKMLLCRSTDTHNR